MIAEVHTIAIDASAEVVDELTRKYAVERPVAKAWTDAALQLLDLIADHHSSAPDDPILCGLRELLQRSLAFASAAGRVLILRTRNYEALCERRWGKRIHWPYPDATMPTPTVATIEATLEWLHDGLGPETFSEWFQDLALRFSPEDLESLRRLPTRKTFNCLAPMEVLPLFRKTPATRFEVACSVQKTAARPAAVTMMFREPRVAVVENVLTPDECRYLVDEARGNTGPSMVRANVRAASRTSRSWSPDGRDHVARSIQERLAQIVGMPVDTAEPLSVHRYNVGDRFQAHYDNPSREVWLSAGGSTLRRVSIVAYLRPARDGGDTWFPRLGLSLSPSVGSVLVFDNFCSSGMEDAALKHAGRPVRDGEKWIATQWFRVPAPLAAEGAS